MHQQNALRIASIVALSALMAVQPCLIHAASRTSESKSKYNKVQQSLKKNRDELIRTRAAERVTLKEIDKADRKLIEVTSELRQNQKAMNMIRQRADSLRAEASSLRVKTEGSQEMLRRKLRALGKYGRHGDELIMLGSSEDLSQMMRRMRYLEDLSRHEKELLRKYSSSMEELSAKLKELDAALAEMREKEQKTRETTNRLEAEKKNKQKLLASIKNERENYERIVKELQESAEKMQKVITRSSSTAAGSYSGKGFGASRGRLPWPVNGSVTIPYGKHSDPRLKAPVFHNGVYIAAAEDALARAVDGGKVVFADFFEGYGQLVIVNHGGGYHTLYANLSEIFLRSGDIINRSDKIGRVGTSGIVDTPALYFEIRYKGKPLNPSQWLSK